MRLSDLIEQLEGTPKDQHDYEVIIVDMDGNEFETEVDIRFVHVDKKIYLGLGDEIEEEDYDE